MALEKKLFNFNVPWEHNIAFSQGAWVKGGRLILLSGQASLDDNGKVVGVGDMALQVQTSLEACRRGLEIAGATVEDIVKVNFYTTDCRAFHKTQPIREAFFSRPFPAQTVMEVTRLAMRDFLVEVEVTAAIDA